jgi:hypothetical protein
MPQPVHRQRHPQNTPFYLCVEDHFEASEQVYGERFEGQYGYFLHTVLKMLLAKGKITPERIALMHNWRGTIREGAILDFIRQYLERDSVSCVCEKPDAN